MVHVNRDNQESRRDISIRSSFRRSLRSLIDACARAQAESHGDGAYIYPSQKAHAAYLGERNVLSA
jgi:hypothetical protein